MAADQDVKEEVQVSPDGVNDGGKKKEQSEELSEPRKDKMLYGIDDVPSPVLWPVFGLQQAVMCITGTLSAPFLVASLICVGDRADVRAQLLSITYFMCGIATILQDTIGVRLPIIQGGSHTFIPPLAAIMMLDRFRCPQGDHSGIGVNGTIDDEGWQMRLREYQGGLIVASLTQVVIGGLGLVGALLHLIGPLTIAPTISLIGLSLTGVVIEFCRHQWGVAMLTVAFILLFSVVLGDVKLPVPAFTRERGCHVTRYPVFQLAPVLLALGLSWAFCHVLTVTDVFPNNATSSNYRARTDIAVGAVQDASWLVFPYPFQFGTPTVSAAGYVGLLAATISSIIESVGDYYAAARVSRAPPPPPHAMNRGIVMEGLTSMLCGLVGSSTATTSYSGNIGAIVVTKVASRRVFQTAGLILTLCGLVGKLGAVLSLIPDPVIGGVNAVMLGMVISVGLVPLQHVDLASSRNLTILGLAFMLGLALPQWIAANPGAIDTGNTELDQVIRVLLGTAMFVGGIVGCVLDNIVPGTPEQRGLLGWKQSQESSDERESTVEESTYDLPFISGWMRRARCCHYFPLSPSFAPEEVCCRKCRSRDAYSTSSAAYDNHVMVMDVHGEEQKGSSPSLQKHTVASSMPA